MESWFRARFKYLSDFSGRFEMRGTPPPYGGVKRGYYYPRHFQTETDLLLLNPLCLEVCVCVCFSAMPRSRPGRIGWCFTYNNPTVLPATLIQLLLLLPAFRAVCFQAEIGEECGTPHFQGYIEFSRQVRDNALQRVVGYVRGREGTREQALEYVRRESKRAPSMVRFRLALTPEEKELYDVLTPDEVLDVGPFEAGNFSEGGQGNRGADLGRVAALCKEYGSVKRVAEECPWAVLKYARGVEALCRIWTAKRVIMPLVTLVYGVTGVGKSWWCIRLGDFLGDDVFIKEPAHKWYDGYEDQKTIIMDDFAGKTTHIALATLLRVIDSHAVRVENKGGSVPMLATKIYVTTNIHPSAWYNWHTRWGQYGALARRFHQVICFSEGLPYVANHGRFFDVRNRGPVDQENPDCSFTPASILLEAPLIYGPWDNPLRTAEEPVLEALPVPVVNPAGVVGYYPGAGPPDAWALALQGRVV